MPDLSARQRWSAVAAAGWCIAFAAVHLFWALGGSFGLASSAGRNLASQRPALFVVFGLYGVVVACLIGVAIIGGVTTAGPISRWRRLGTLLIGLAGVGLFARGVALEILLVMDIGGLREQIGQLETHWSLIVWNPWFTLGGAALVAVASPRRFPRPGSQ